MISSSRLRIIVMGYLVRGPLGGIAWHYLQYVLALTRLGHDVFFLEDSSDAPSCYDPVRNAIDTDPAYGLTFATNAFDRIGCGARWAYYDGHRGCWLGPARQSAPSVCATADVLVNVSGVNTLRSWMDHVQVRILVDTDPVFTQIRHLADPLARATSSDHTAFFSFGENIGQPGCTIPDDGFPWKPTRQPIVMDAWKPTRGRADSPWSTVMLWDSYPSAQYNGIRYGMKSESFAPYVDLPSRCADRFQLAVGSRPEPRKLLAAAGWTVVDPREPTRDPWTYQDFIGRSKGEFSVAKHGYVVSQSGWFSERSAVYLASGRPAVVQETGFSRWLRADGGVCPFTTPDEALEQLEAVNASYDWQCLKARRVAENYFESTGVLTDLLQAALAHRGPISPA